ncbi:hypothetical protein ACWATR_38540 [Nostoc sp. UIC 10890]
MRKAIAHQATAIATYMQLQIIITHSPASNITLSDPGFYDCQDNFVLPPADANAEVKEILSTTSEKSDRFP